MEIERLKIKSELAANIFNTLMLKETMREFWIVFIFAFLMRIVIGGCITFNYIIKDHNETIHELLEEIRTYKGKNSYMTDKEKLEVIRAENT